MQHHGGGNRLCHKETILILPLDIRLAASGSRENLTFAFYNLQFLTCINKPNTIKFFC